MPNSQVDAFFRIYPQRDQFRGRSLRVLAGHVVDVLLLASAMVIACLIVDVATSRGHILLEKAEDVAALNKLGNDVFTLSEESLEEENLRFTVRSILAQDYGLITAVWWSRGTIWGAPFAAAYNAIPQLRTSSNAAVLLIGLLIVVLILRKTVRARVRISVVGATLEIVNRLRKSLHRQSLRLGPSDLDGRHNETALELFTSRMERIREGLFTYISGYWRDVIAAVLLTLLALSFHWHLTLLCLIPLAFTWYFAERRHAHIKNRDRLSTDRLYSDLKLLSESMNKSRLVRGYGMENFEHDRFELYLETYHKDETNYLVGRGRMGPFATLLIFLCVGVVTLLMVSKVLSVADPVSISVVALLLIVFSALAWIVLDLRHQWDTRRDVTLAADRVLRYISQIPEVGQPVGAKFLQPLSKFLQFEAVTYTLPGTHRKVLDAFDLRITAGTTTAIVSVDALSARAIANLLPRFIEAQSGRVLIDGEDIAWGTLESLRAEAIYVSEEDPFFTGTVLENITWGSSDYSLQDATEAAKVAHAHHFILKLSQGYETVLGEHGEQLDAGQSFRLGLARAVLRNPALLIIEEPDEQLDEDTKSLLDDAYQRLCKDRTVLFLPARLSTIRRADRIVFIHEGKVQAVGTHAELLKSSSLYRHWEYMRFNQFRHAVEAGE